MKKFNRILVTGGAGFIGGNLIRKLLRDSESLIFNVDKINYAGDQFSLTSFVKNLGEDNQKRYKFFNGDIADKKIINDVIFKAKPDIIIHCAAETHVDNSIEKPENFISSNIIGTFQLLQTALDYYRSIKEEIKEKFKILHVSTDEVFGSLNQIGFFNEKSQYKPNSPYSASKASSDHLVRAWFHTYGLPCVITNCSNNYGPWQYREKLIPNTISKALLKKEIPVYGNGENIRDWLYVDDHIDAILLVAENGLPGKNYCIGGNNEKTNIDVVNQICNYLDIKNPGLKAHRSLIKFVEDRPGHDFRYAINSSLIKQDLNWVPKYTFEEGIEKTINWYLKNKQWLLKDCF